MEQPSSPGVALRALGRTELRVSGVTFGAMADGPPGELEDGRRVEVIRAGIDAGVAAIDSAPLYGFGRSERVIGRALRGLGRRPLVFTKVGLRWDDTHGEPLFRSRDEQGTPIVVRRDSRPESVLLEIERSLERLRIDALDLVQVHHRDRLVPIAETMGALRDAVRSGAVRHVGVSNFSAAEIAESIAALGDVPLASAQSPYSLLVRGVENDALRAARVRGVGFLAYSPLAQGLLGGTYGPERALRDGDWRAELPLFSVRSRAVITRAIAEVVRPIAERRSATPAQIALAWVIARPGVTSAIAGASSAAQVRENAGAMRLHLEPGEIDTLDRAFRALRVDRHPGLASRARDLVRRARDAIRAGRASG